MATSRRSRGRPRSASPSVLFPIKGPADLRQRLKVACAEEGMTYAELIADMLDRRDARVRRAREAQPSPLHRPRNMERLEA